jgi:DNA repair exonuclease SbcCD ATPase subunit
LTSSSSSSSSLSSLRILYHIMTHIGDRMLHCVSLSVRCALHRLRLPGFSMSQIFIDEGFGACDRKNAQRIRDMLEALAAVGGYDSVWLCSHLDAVRDVADRVIDVEKGESGSSRIRIAH